MISDIGNYLFQDGMILTVTCAFLLTYSAIIKFIAILRGKRIFAKVAIVEFIATLVAASGLVVRLLGILHMPYSGYIFILGVIVRAMVNIFHDTIAVQSNGKVDNE